MSSWRPWSRNKIEELVIEELIGLDPSEREAFDKCRVEPGLLSWPRGRGCGDDAQNTESTWMLARRGPRVLFYDTVEEEFGTGRVEREPFLEDYGTWGEKLAWAFRQFLEGR